MKQRGKFITLEGVDGAGKSTQFQVIADTLQQRGVSFVTTREPGGTPTAESIREILLHQPMSAKSELLMMFAAREENLQNIVRPALKEGKWVLCDRFTDASYAYQAAGRMLPKEWVDMLADFVHPDLKPDLTVLFDIPTDEALKRLSEDRDRFESEDRLFRERVRLGYLELAKQEPERFLVIDATRPKEKISKELREMFQTWG
ncbi:MAG: dTMP kinase [Burkholderiales bacterium]|nr:dTMP kinase [Burkholderiales bacterium]